MDSAGNTPLGVQGVYELIGTAEELAQFQSVKWIDRNIILPNALNTVCLIGGNAELMASYNQAVSSHLEEKIENEKMRNYLAFRLLQGHLEEFRPNLSQEKEKMQAFGVKKELYRPFQEILSSLSLLFSLKEKSTSQRIRELQDLKIFSPEGATHLIEAVEKVLKMRLKAHLFYEDETEYLFHMPDDEMLDSQLLLLTR